MPGIAAGMDRNRSMILPSVCEQTGHPYNATSFARAAFKEVDRYQQMANEYAAAIKETRDLKDDS